MTDDLVKKATGESGTGLLWTIVGAAAFAAVVAPFLSRLLGVTPMIAMLVGGVALAFLATGALRQLGQGAVLFSIVNFAVGMIQPVIAGLVPGNAGGAETASGV